MSSLFFNRSGPRFAIPETALAYCRRILHELLDIGPEMFEADCLRVIEELAFVDGIVLRIAERVKNNPAYHDRWRLEREPCGVTPSIPGPTPPHPVVTWSGARLRKRNWPESRKRTPKRDSPPSLKLAES